MDPCHCMVFSVSRIPVLMTCTCSFDFETGSCVIVFDFIVQFDEAFSVVELSSLNPIP